MTFIGDVAFLLYDSVLHEGVEGRVNLHYVDSGGLAMGWDDWLLVKHQIDAVFLPSTAKITAASENLFLYKVCVAL